METVKAIKIGTTELDDDLCERVISDAKERGFSRGELHGHLLGIVDRAIEEELAFEATEREKIVPMADTEG